MTEAIRWTNETRRLDELQPWPRNPRQINKDQAKRLAQSFDEFGQVETIAIGPGNEVYNGHQRLSVLMDKHGGAYEVEVRVSSRPLSEKEREKLTVFLHKGAAGSWNWGILANEFEVGELLEWGFSERDLQLSFPDMDERPELEDMPEELPGAKTLKLWMDFPSKNRYDIPDLLLEKCTDLPCENLCTWAGPDVTGKDVHPEDWFFYTWGSDSTRGLPFDKTILNFYTNDERFESFWKETNKFVSKVLNAGINYSVSPNYSLWFGMSRALHIYNTFRSRWVGRYMQESGIKIIPDVNWSDEASFDYCLLGIPVGAPIISIQLQTLKTQDEIGRAVYGLSRSIRELQPKRALIYAARSVGEKVVDMAGIKIPVIYVENRVAVRREKMESVRKEV